MLISPPQGAIAKPKSLRILRQQDSTKGINYVAVGTDGTLYLTDNWKSLYKTTDLNMTKTLIKQFDYGIAGFTLLKNGTMLTRLNVSGTYKLVRSTDDGETWADIMNPTIKTLGDILFEDSSGSVYMPSYEEFDGKIYRSDDHGETWNIINTITDIYHIHYITEDPYNPGTLYIGTGDQDAQSKIFKTVDKCENLVLVGEGLQIYRSVSMQFTPNYLVWGMDSNNLTQPPHIVRMNRVTNEIEKMQIALQPFYWSWKTAKGELLFATTPEQAGTTDPLATIYYSNDEGATWHIIYQVRFVGKSWYWIQFVGEHDNKLYFKHTYQGLVVWSFCVEIVDADTAPLAIFDSAMTVDSSNYLIVGNTFSKTYLARSGTNLYELNSGGLESLVAGNGLNVKSSNGTRYKISVGDDGNIAVTAL